jgi:hypothetical protein
VSDVLPAGAAVGGEFEEILALDHDQLPTNRSVANWLEVRCGLKWDDPAALCRYTGLPELVKELSKVSEVRAINLQTGIELNETQYRKLCDEDERKWLLEEVGCESVDVNLALKRESVAGRPVVVLTATNISKRPITVDGQLVFDFLIGVEDEDGGVLTCARDVSVKEWSKKKWDERITTLAPGQSLSRRLDPESGIRNFALEDKPIPPGNGGDGEYLYVARPATAKRTVPRSRLLTVHCGVRWGRNPLEEYVRLPTETERLTWLSGFRAINLETGDELDLEQYLRGQGRGRAKADKAKGRAESSASP